MGLLNHHSCQLLDEMSVSIEIPHQPELSVQLVPNVPIFGNRMLPVPIKLGQHKQPIIIVSVDERLLFFIKLDLCPKFEFYFENAFARLLALKQQLHLICSSCLIAMERSCFVVGTANENSRTSSSVYAWGFYITAVVGSQWGAAASR
ncbi:hypothetical protein [Aurantiacibacter sp. D1-12]|uniref:hypothetical protein n=1 Tax=Aurantiacibacter sp. D1-12 TaxID=2993658 RepID=UPI00237D1458|nr:hypothetical protein [Aurantiacibacter sp. D1-12]MDE1467473.1 hypothetical protein [Aurantiacibacter sp. D1-12]